MHDAAARAGVDALTVGLARELAEQGVRVNGVAPGLIETGIHAAAGDPDRLTPVVGRVPMGRAGQPDEIAPAIAWLLGPESSYVTGAILRVAGGLRPPRQTMWCRSQPRRRNDPGSVRDVGSRSPRLT